MATTTNALVEEALKEVYGDDLYEQINLNTECLDIFEESETMRWDGKVAVDALHHKRNQSAMAVNPAGGNLPNAGNQEYEDLRIPIRKIYGAIAIDGQLMEQAFSSEAAFINVVDAEITGLVNDIAREQERMIQGDGNGILCLANGAGGGTATISVDAPGGVAGATFGNRFLFPGQVIAIWAANGSAITAMRTVSSVNAAGTQVTFTATVDGTQCPDNAILTKGTTRGSVSEGSYAHEPMGLRGMFDNQTFVTTFHGLDRSAVGNEFFNIKVFTSVGALSEDIFHRALNACHDRSGIIPDTFLCHSSVHREYIKRTQADRRYTGDQTMKPDAGIKGGSRTQIASLTFNDVPFRLARYYAFGYLDLIDKDACKKYTLQEGKWIDEDGSMWHRRQDSDDFQADYRIMKNFGAKRNNSSARLTGINATIDINREA